MGTIYAGYMGLAKIGGVVCRFDSANLAVKQEVNAPDLIMGDYDRDVWNYGPITVGGSISGPVTQSFAAGASGIWQWATKRDSCGQLTEKTVEVGYYCRAGKTFTGVLCNSLHLSCAAGDTAKFSIEIMGKSASSGGAAITSTLPEKIVTWDKVIVSASGPGISGAIDFSSFDITIANNCVPAYTLSQANLFPVQIIAGLRSISGSISVYNVPTADGALNWDAYTAAGIDTLSFSIGTFSTSANVKFHRVEPVSATGPMISTVNFTGVTHQSLWD